MKKMSLWFIAPLALVLVACSSTGTSSGTSNSGDAARTTTRRSPNLLTANELAEAGELNAFEAIERYRATWLRVRGQTTFGSGGGQQSIKVYVNGSLRGNVEELRRFRVTNIERMRFLSGREATARYGTDHPDGAILITLKSR